MRPTRTLLRRAVALAIVVAQASALAVAGMVSAALPARAATLCATPGKDGSPGTLSGVYNSYYPPAAAGTLAAGSTSLQVGAVDTTSGGANTAIAAGDLLLIVQMQDGSFSSTNGATYGDGATGSGYTSLSSAGLYEYVAVTSVAGSTITFTGAGSGNGLINSYHEAAASAMHGQQTYQIVRVPQFVNATLGNNYTAAYWNGATGGVAALDVATTLNLGGANIYATGDGFRGGGFSVANSTPASILNNDWAASATMNGVPTSKAPGHGFKGEGILGTPAFTFGYTNFSAPNNPIGPAMVKTSSDGYPGGDMARGAPGNAGGGGTDMNPSTNDSNTGGGGGANAGAGGNGGYPWSTNYPNYSLNTPPGQHTAGSDAAADANHNPDLGGRGASTLTSSVARLFMGGGGGAGTNNNGSDNNSYNNYGSSGGTGGGIVMMRIASASGSAATIYANGTTGLAPLNDGGGGGGAGGTVEITSPSSFSGITVNASGAAGTTANATASGLGNQHGPGGGGGGGAVLTSSAVSSAVTGGAAGTTTTLATTYGATAGANGTASIVSAASVPGVSSGAECPSGTGTNTLYTGPNDTGDASFGGAEDTGSFDGSLAATNNNDFTPALIPMSGVTSINRLDHSRRAGGKQRNAFGVDAHDRRAA